MKALWSITDHVCRMCLGRVLERREEDGRHVVRCAECGLEAQGGVRALCACGTKLKTGAAAGLRCAPNQARGPDAPQEIIVEYVGESGGHPQARRRAGAKDFHEVEGQGVLWEEE